MERCVPEREHAWVEIVYVDTRSVLVIQESRDTPARIRLHVIVADQVVPQKEQFDEIRYLPFASAYPASTKCGPSLSILASHLLP